MPLCQAGLAKKYDKFLSMVGLIRLDKQYWKPQKKACLYAFAPRGFIKYADMVSLILSVWIFLTLTYTHFAQADLMVKYGGYAIRRRCSTSGHSPNAVCTAITSGPLGSPCSGIFGSRESVTINTFTLPNPKPQALLCWLQPGHTPSPASGLGPGYAPSSPGLFGHRLCPLPLHGPSHFLFPHGARPWPLFLYSQVGLSHIPFHHGPGHTPSCLAVPNHISLSHTRVGCS